MSNILADREGFNKTGLTLTKITKKAYKQVNLKMLRVDQVNNVI